MKFICNEKATYMRFHIRLMFRLSLCERQVERTQNVDCTVLS